MVCQPDQGLFEALGYHILNGKQLYTDVFDHKPPGIFLLNAGYFLIGGPGESSVAYGTMLFVLLQTLVFYRLLQQITKQNIHSFLGTCVFILLFFDRQIFGSGNYTEQYAVLLTSTGLLFFLRFREMQRRRDILISAAAFGTSIWFKEPFLWSAIPCMLALIYFWEKKELGHRLFWQSVIAFFVPSALFLLWVFLFSTWKGFYENFEYSRSYATYRSHDFFMHLWKNRVGFFLPLFGQVWIGFFAWMLGVISLLSGRWGRVLAFLLLGQQAMDWVATALPGSWFAHYYLQTTPLAVVIIIQGLIWAGEWLNKFVSWYFTRVFLFAALFIAGWNLGSIKTWKWSPEKTYSDAIGKYLDEHEPAKPRHIVLASSDLGFYFPKVQAISHMRYTVPYPFHWTNLKSEARNHRCEEDSTNLVNNLPPYIIYNGKYSIFYCDCHMDSIVIKNYEEVARTILSADQKVILLKRKR